MYRTAITLDVNEDERGIVKLDKLIYNDLQPSG